MMPPVEKGLGIDFGASKTNIQPFLFCQDFIKSMYCIAGRVKKKSTQIIKVFSRTICIHTT